jgi:WD40 repeat protein
MSLILISWVLPDDPRYGTTSLADLSADCRYSSNKQGISVTAMSISRSHKYLFAGTSVGSLRIYQYPPDPELGERYAEYFMHGDAIVTIKESCDSKFLTTMGADGSIFVFKLFTKERPLAELEFDKANNKTNITTDTDSVVTHDSITTIKANHVFIGQELVGYMDEIATKYNNDVVIMSSSDMEDHVMEVVDLQKRLNDLQNKFTFEMRNLGMFYSSYTANTANR